MARSSCDLPVPDGPEIHTRAKGTTPAPAIQMGSFRAMDLETEFDTAAWYAQYRLPAMARMPGSVATRVMVSVAGWAKYSILYEFTSLEARRLSQRGQMHMEWPRATLSLGSLTPLVPSRRLAMEEDAAWSRRLETAALTAVGWLLGRGLQVTCGSGTGWPVRVAGFIILVAAGKLIRYLIVAHLVMQGLQGSAI